MDYTGAIQSTLPTIEKEYKRIAAFLRTFDEDRWNQPSYCPDWNTAQVVGHITLGAEFFTSTAQNGLEGNYGFPFGAKDRDEFMQIRTSKMNDSAALPGEKRVDLFEEKMRVYLDFFEGLSPEDYEKRAWHRRGILPMRYFIIQRLNELLLHEWDIRNDPDAPLTSDALKVAAGNLQQRYPLFYSFSPVEGLEGSFRFETTDTGQACSMKIENGEAVDTTGTQSNYDASFFATASDFSLLVSGRGAIPDKEKSGDFRIEGDRAKADALIPTLFFPI